MSIIIRQFLITIIFGIFIQLITTQKPSPCPNIFTYEPTNNDNNDRWYGILSLQTNDDLNGIWIHIILDEPALQLGNWFGNSSNVDNREFIIRNPKYHLEAGPPVTVRFFVVYEHNQQIPSVTSVRLNGKTICNQQETLIATEPTLHLSEIRLDNNNNNNRGQGHNKIPPGQNKRPPQSFNNGNNKKNKDKFQQQQQQQQQQQPPQQQPTTNDVNQQQQLPIIDLNDNECGRIIMQPSPLISYGQTTTKGQFPWHAAIYHSHGSELMYTCGGTLISKIHILTAAHCTAKPQTNQQINPSNLLVSLGKYILKKFGPEVQDIEVIDIFIHPQYNSSNLFNDISILKLSHQIQLTDYVRPCCLWNDKIDNNLNNIIGQNGIVVGWGFNENRELSNDLMQTKMPIISTVNCIYSNREFFARFTFEKNFCAGYQNGTSVCNGDSGGGLLLPITNTNRWQIRGLVSVGVALQGYGICDPSHYVVFTDVAKHLKWIKDTMRK